MRTAVRIALFACVGLLLVLSPPMGPAAADPDGEWTRVRVWEYSNDCYLDIDMVTPDFGAVLGGAGLFMYQAGTFTPVTSTRYEPFTGELAVDMLSETDGWSVGGRGTIRH